MSPVKMLAVRMEPTAFGGNGVANSTVFGGIAGDMMGRDVSGRSLREADETILAAEIDRAMHPLGKTGGNVHELRRKLQDVMWDDVGVIRTASGMNRALSALGRYRRGTDGHRRFGRQSRLQSDLA